MTNNINGVVPPGEVIVDPVTGEDKSRALPRSSNGDQAYNMFRPADMLPPASQGSNAGLVQVQNGVQPQPAVNNVTTPAIVSQPQEQVQTKAAAVDPNSPTDGLNLLAGLVTTPEQEEKMRKASIQSQRIMAVTNALRHIGNVIGTVHGANAQQFNDPVTEEQQRYLREKAVRDHNNMKFMTYQQAKAAQDAKARQWEADFGLKMANAASQDAYRREQARIAGERAANQKAYQEGNLARMKQADADKKAYNDARLKQDKWYKGGMLGVANRRVKDQERRTTAYVNRQSGAGSSVAPLDTPKGQITPNGRSYSNQIEQIWSYAREKGLVQESDVEKRLRTLGLGKDKSADVRHQMVLDLLRTNQSIGDYASTRLGWTYGNGGDTGMDLGLEDDEDEMDLRLE